MTNHRGLSIFLSSSYIINKLNDKQAWAVSCMISGFSIVSSASFPFSTEICNLMNLKHSRFFGLISRTFFLLFLECSHLPERSKYLLLKQSDREDVDRIMRPRDRTLNY